MISVNSSQFRNGFVVVVVVHFDSRVVVIMLSFWKTKKGFNFLDVFKKVKKPTIFQRIREMEKRNRKDGKNGE